MAEEIDSSQPASGYAFDCSQVQCSIIPLTRSFYHIRTGEHPKGVLRITVYTLEVSLSWP